MVTANFRFYGGLNDFMPPSRRQRGFDCRCARAATAKHMIEALGVPHTEVALLLIDGESCGLDTHIDDADIACLAERDERIVLTRDRDLLKRRKVEHGCYVRALKAEAQLKEIVERLRLAEHLQPFTLCLRCNAPLEAVAKEDVMASLPPSVRAAHSQFQSCRVCRGIFWKGAHWSRMRELLAQAAAPR